MSIFSSSSQSYLGIDFDLHSVKIVELKNDKGKPKLINYGYYDHDLERRVSEKDENVAKETASVIREIHKKAGMVSKVAISALPAYSVFSSIITLPGISKKDLANAVKWEAKKVVPLPLDDMILHWDILEGGEEKKVAQEKSEVAESARPEIPQDTSKPSEGFFPKERALQIIQKKDTNQIRILLTAAPKDLVNRYIEIFKNTGLALISVDTESFALIRSLIGNDNSIILVVDLDYSVTNISVIRNRIPYLNRSINVGGITITRAIATSLNITLKRAEQFKYDIGVMVGGEHESEIPKTIEQVISPIIDEIKYSVNIFKTQGKENIDKIILTGGSSLLPNLPQYISKVLNMRVYLGDPWARVEYPEELKPALIELGPRFSVAIGLAMKEIR